MASREMPVLAERLRAGLTSFEVAHGNLPKLSNSSRHSLVRQLIDSERRNLYVKYLTETDLGTRAADPTEVERFDPLKAALIRSRAGEIEESLWMLFLFVHFGKNRNSGYRYARDVYGRLGSQDWWTWRRVTNDIDGFRFWIDENCASIQARLPTGGFGNHRKYESLRGWTATGTGRVVASYIDWTGEGSLQRDRVDSALFSAGKDPAIAFDNLYQSMSEVARFGRTARFDYLSMMGKLKLADLKPGKAYFEGSTGPRRGAQLLFSGDPTKRIPAQDLEDRAGQLALHLDVRFDVLEDALCNWQKSPFQFKPFRG